MSGGFPPIGHIALLVPISTLNPPGDKTRTLSNPEPGAVVASLPLNNNNSEEPIPTLL